MEFSIRISYKRPSTDVAWGKPSKDYEDYVEMTYDDTGNRLSGVEEGEDTLERTQTTVWKDQESFFEFKTDATVNNWLTESANNRDANGIEKTRVENKEGFFD